MSNLDWFLIFILVGFILSGVKGGFIYSFGSFLGVILGAFVAGRLYEPLSQIMGNGANWAQVVSFLAVFLIINQLVGLIFYIINKVFKIIMIIPFLGIINRLGGAIFGFIEGMLIMGIGFFFISRFELAESITQILGGSKLAPFLIKIGNVLTFLLPRIFQELQSVIA